MKLTDEQVKAASAWYKSHSNHVRNIISDEVILHAYPPSEEDITNPSLWKPFHWIWFLQNHRIVNQ